MARREYLYLGERERAQRRRVSRWRGQCFLGEPPAGKGVGIAMDDGNPRVCDVDAHMHRQRGEAGQGLRHRSGGLPQALDDAVRPLDGALVHPLGIGASAAGGVVRSEKLRFHVAARRVKGKHRVIHGFELSGIGVEPVEIAVEHQRLRAGVALEVFDQRLERIRIAVEAAGDPQGLDAQGSGDRERARPVVIRGRAAAARVLGYVFQTMQSRSICRKRDVALEDAVTTA